MHQFAISLDAPEERLKWSARQSCVEFPITGWIATSHLPTAAKAAAIELAKIAEMGGPRGTWTISFWDPAAGRWLPGCLAVRVLWTTGSRPRAWVIGSNSWFADGKQKRGEE